MGLRLEVMQMKDWQKRLEQIQDENETDSFEKPASLPCITCGKPSASQVCSQCNRQKW